MKTRRLTSTSFFKTCGWRDVIDGLEVSRSDGRPGRKDIPAAEEPVFAPPWLQDQPQRQRQSTCLPPSGGSSQHWQRQTVSGRTSGGRRLDHGSSSSPLPVALVRKVVFDPSFGFGLRGQQRVHLHHQITGPDKHKGPLLFRTELKPVQMPR